MLITMNTRRLPLLACALLLIAGLCHAQPSHQRPPNIIYIYADDLGYGELGCYGQEIIHTPNIDALAERGMRFTTHYSGSPVCAPSRCVLMTGYDTGRSYIRDNSPWARRVNPMGQGQEPLIDSAVTLAELLQARGYRTGVAGKWGLGGPQTQGIPTNQGFDDFFGYHCQWIAHSYYPDHLWHNEEQIPFNDNPVPSSLRLNEAPQDWSVIEGEHYAPDAIAEHALAFIADAAQRDQPFFFWYASVIPHVALHIPADQIERYGYPASMDPVPYLGNRGYTAHPRPHAAYASMITYLDEQVGRIVALLEEQGIADNTLIIFSSDNGASYAGGADAAYFNSVAGLRGLKGSCFEGGIRVPMIAGWPGHIAPGTTSDLVCAQVDMLPTLIQVAGGEAPEGIDGVSLLPTLTGQGEQQISDFYYWELGQRQAIRQGDWKLVREFNRPGAPAVYLFNLADDPNEETNLADQHPQRVRAMIDQIIAHRTEPTVEGFRHPEFSSE